MATTVTPAPTDVRTDVGQLEKDFDGLSSTFSKDEQAAVPPMGSIDAEVAAFAAQDWRKAQLEISPEEDRRLYRLVVKRVLVVMLGTYFRK